jgi:hypothetical protein
LAEAQKITVDDGTWDALTPSVVLDTDGATAGADGGIHLDEGWRWTPEGGVGRESDQIAGVEKGRVAVGGEGKIQNGVPSLEGGEGDGVPSLEGRAASCALLEEIGFDSASAKEAFDVAVALPNPKP